jgi:hypothetical protein
MPIGGNISSGGAAADTPPEWVVDYEVDFTAAANVHDFTGGTATKSMGGVTWTADSIAKATTFETIEGEGLVIEPTSASDWGTSNANAPRLTATISDLSPSADESSIVVVQAVATVTSTEGDVDSNYDGFGIIVSDASWANWICHRRLYADSLFGTPDKGEELLLPGVSAGYLRINEEVGSVPGYHEVAVFPGGGGQALSGASYPADPMTGSVFVAPFSYDARGVDPTSFSFEVSNLRAGPWAMRGGIGTAGFTVTCTSFRVLRQVMS